MATTQAQYQIRLALGVPGDVSADLTVWADAFEDATAPLTVNYTATLRNRSQVAEAIVAEQTRRNARTSVLVLVAPGSIPGELPVAHLAAAGALIEALSDRGLDHTSPEAALALAAWVGVEPARKHLLGASTAARLRAASSSPAEVARAFELDAD